MRRMAAGVACALALLVPWVAAAAETPESTPFSAALHSLAALAIVVAAIVGAAWLLRRLQSGGGASHALLKTIATTPVGPRERVVLVEIQDTWLVLGVAQGSVRMLHTLPRAEVPNGTVTGFGTWLANAKAGRRD
jgi:flagellar protein FliO/FliZ